MAEATEAQKKQQEETRKEQDKARENASKQADTVQDESTEEDEAARGLEASEVSTKEFDGNVGDDEKIVETNNHASMTSGEYQEGLDAARQAAREGKAPRAEGQDSAAERAAGKADQPKK